MSINSNESFKKVRRKTVTLQDAYSFVTIESEEDTRRLHKRPQKSTLHFSASRPSIPVAKPDITYIGMFRYASYKDISFYLLGVLCAIITGLTVPANTVVFGNLANALVTMDMHLNQSTLDYKPHANDTNIDIIKERDKLYQEINLFAQMTALIGLVMLVFTYLAVLFFNLAAHSQINRLRRRFYRSVLYQDISFFDVHRTDDLAYRMNENLIKIEDGLGEKLAVIIYFMVSFFTCNILALIKGWKLTLICLITSPIIILAVILILMNTSDIESEETKTYASAGTCAYEAISGIRTVKAYNGEQKELDDYKNFLKETCKLNNRRILFEAIGFGLLWFCIYGSYGLAFWYGVTLILEYYECNGTCSHYSVGVMVTVFLAVMMGSMNIGLASPYVETFGIARGACTMIFEIIEQRPYANPIETKSGLSLSKRIHKIEFLQVNFSYPTRRIVKVLNDFNLMIRQGECVALVGNSGSGKNTCIQLLQRFYDPTEGTIIINGRHNLRDLNTKWWRSRISVICQEPILFDATIYENIRYGCLNATAAEIESAAKEANAWGFIRQFPNGLNTLIGENGVRLSDGQKQRISIARAIVRNPEIVILEEKSTSLDSVSEQKIQDAIKLVSRSRTVVIAAHRLSTIKSADRVVVIDSGHVVEVGTHDDLMKVQGYYYNLILSQIDIELDDARVDVMSTTYSHIDYDVQSNITDQFLQEKNSSDIIEDERVVSVWTLFKYIYRFNIKELHYIFGAGIASLVLGAAMPVFGLLFGSILHFISIYNDFEYIRSTTDEYCIYFLILGITVGFAFFVQILCFGVTGEKLTERLRAEMFEKILSMEVCWFDRSANAVAILCRKLFLDAAIVQTITGQRIGAYVQTSSTIIFVAIIAIYFEWSLGLLAISFTPIILFSTYLQRSLLFREDFISSGAIKTSTKLAVESIAKIRTVISLGIEDLFYSRYVEILQTTTVQAHINSHIRGLVYGLARSVMYFAYSACFYYGGTCVLDMTMDFGNVFKVSQAVVMGTTSIATVLAFGPSFQKGILAARSIHTILNRESTPLKQVSSEASLLSQSPRNTLNWSMDEGTAKFTNVDFSYPNFPDKDVLHDLTWEAKSGQKVALVGPSGCGKSTCIQLLLRFYDIKWGNISVDNMNIHRISIDELRKQIALVTQQPTIFARSVMMNIAYGDNSRLVEMDEIIEAAKMANAHNFIIALPGSYYTHVGERGNLLSGGQKQRIAIARALIRNPKILLLDEPTSGLDTENEQIVLDCIKQASEGRTTITVAHRLATIIHSDIIFVINKGTIEEFGTHSELLEKRGLYYRLYETQTETLV